MSKKNRGISIIVIIALILAVFLPGCSGNKDEPQIPSETSAVSTPSEQVSNDPLLDKKVTLTFWNQWADPVAEPSTLTFRQVQEEWNALYPNIKIEVDSTPSANSAYKTKLKTAIASGMAPDIFMTSHGSFSMPFVSGGDLLCLDDYLKGDALKGIMSGVMQSATYGGKIYGLPFFQHASFLFCNSELFESNNISYPTTYDELISVSKQFRDLGITPIALGLKEKWPSSHWFEAAAIKGAGNQYVVDALEKKASFDNPMIIKAAKAIQDLGNAGAFEKGALGLSYFESTAAFQQGQAAMVEAGTWDMPAFEADNVPVKGKVKLLNWPTLEDGNGSSTDLWGGPYEHFSISAKCAEPDVAFAYMMFLSKNISKFSFINGNGLPVWELDEGTKTKSPLFAQALELTKDVTSMTSGWSFYFASDASPLYQDRCVELINNLITPEEFAKQLQLIHNK